MFSAPQDSDGDKSEDNLVVDVSNEVSSYLYYLNGLWHPHILVALIHLKMYIVSSGYV